MEQALGDLARRRTDLRGLQAGYDGQDEKLRGGSLAQFPALTLGFTRDFVLVPVLIASALCFVLIPLDGHLSDRLARKPVSLAGEVLTGLFGFVSFSLPHTRQAARMFIPVALDMLAATL